MKTFKFSLVLRPRENADVFITLDDSIYGSHSKRVNILYLFHLITALLQIWGTFSFSSPLENNPGPGCSKRR